MANLGFTNFDDTSTPAPTIPEILATLSGPQKVAVLNGFAEKVRPAHWRQWMKETEPGTSNAVPRSAIKALYTEIDNIEVWCRAEMRGERLVTPAVVDPETGEVTTPAVYNTPPTTVTALRVAAGIAFTEIFTSGEVTAVVNKMIVYSRSDGAGTFTYYKAEVVK